METFAGFAEHTDQQVGRLVDSLREMGIMENTLFIYIVGDNGASAEGGPEGAYNEMMALNGIINTAEINMPHLDGWGGPNDFSTLRHRLGVGRRYAVPVDQANRIALRWHHERRGDPLA